MIVLTAKQIAVCASIFGLGVATPPTIEKVKSAAHAKRAAVKPRPVKSSPAPVKTPPGHIVAASEPVRIECSPISGAGGFYDMQPVDIPAIPISNGSLSSGGRFDYTNVAGDGGFYHGGFRPPILTPSIPEPDAWAMMVLGFGFVGFAMRGSYGKRI